MYEMKEYILKLYFKYSSS